MSIVACAFGGRMSIVACTCAFTNWESHVDCPHVHPRTGRSHVECRMCIHALCTHWEHVTRWMERMRPLPQHVFLRHLEHLLFSSCFFRLARTPQDRNATDKQS